MLTYSMYCTLLLSYQIHDMLIVEAYCQRACTYVIMTWRGRLTEIMCLPTRSMTWWDKLTESMYRKVPISRTPPLISDKSGSFTTFLAAGKVKDKYKNTLYFLSGDTSSCVPRGLSLIPYPSTTVYAHCIHKGCSVMRKPIFKNWDFFFELS